MSEKKQNQETCDGSCMMKIHTCDMGTCENCGGETTSGSYKLCDECAQGAGVCHMCGKKVKKFE